MWSGLQTVVLLAGGLLALGSLVGSFYWLHRKRLIDDLPTSRAQGVFIGFTEIKGTAESESPFTSYLAGVPCVQYAWRVEEQWSRMVTETYRDAQGRTQTRLRRETGWTRVADGEQRSPFYLRDDTGIVRVVPDRARIEGIGTFDQTCGRSDPLYFARGPAGEIANSDHRRRFHETAVPLHAPLYIVGQARERQDVIAPEVAHDERSPMFLISTRTEKQVSAGFGWWSFLLALLGFVIAIGVVAALGLVSGEGLPAIWGPYALAAAGFLAALGLGWVWMVYNSLIHLRQRVRQAWSQVDVQLKWRKDLIPNLVQAVEGYRSHEAEVQALVAKLRAQLAATPPGAAGPDPRGLAPAVRMVVERYPDLKASGSFLALQQSLSEAEQRIALARDYFNQITAFYNIRLAIIPDRFVASLARLRPQPLLTATDFERAEVKVQLAE